MNAGFPRAILLAMLVVLVFSIGCSSSSGVDTAPSVNGSRNAVSDSTGHEMWGLWQFHADPVNQTLEAIRLREGAMHLNALVFLEPPALVNLSLDSFEFNGNMIDAVIGLRHPFLGLHEFSGFDVCGIFISNGSVSGFDNADLVMAGEGDTRLLNPDGYTRWWNPSEFPSDGTMFGYKDGLLGQPDSIGNFNCTLNGYKYFCDDLAGADDTLDMVTLENRGLFSAGQKNIRRYLIELGNDGLVFNYAVDASWQFPTGNPPFVAPDDFGPAANRVEAWRADITETNNLFNDGSSSGGSLKLSIDVYDWFNAEMNVVKAESPDMSAPIQTAALTGGGDGYSTYEVEFTSVNPPQGSVDVLITVESEAVDYQGILPGETVSAYFVHTASVDDNPGIVVGDLSLVTDCGGDPCAGEFFDVEVSEAYDPGGGSLTITWDIDGDMDFMDDLDGDDTNLSGTFQVVIPGSYDVYCRVDNGNTFADGGPLTVDVLDCTPDPTIVKEVDFNYTGNGTVYNNGMVYIAFTDWSGTAGHHGVYIYDVEPIADTFLAGSYTYSLWMEPIAYRDGYCYLGGYYGWGTKTIDVDPPESATEVDTDDTQLTHGARYGMMVEGDYLYEAAQWSGLMIYDISDPSNPVKTGQTGPPVPGESSNWSFDVDVDPVTDYAYLITGHSSLSFVFSVIDISSKSSPTVVHSLILPYQPREVEIQGDYAYVSLNGHLSVVDISDPEAAFIETTISVGNFYNTDMELEGNYAYIAANNNLIVVDISDPTSPSQLTTLAIPGGARSLAIDCGVAYVSGGELVIVDLY